MGALDNIRVIDFGHVLAAPFCTMILGDLDAEIIKIEPPFGDDSRQFGPFIKEKETNNKQSGYFISVNRNKKSTCINLKKKEGKEIVKKLIEKADVVVENFRPTTMEKLGFSYEEVKEIKSDIIYCSISGFGHDTLPIYAAKPAYDMIAQAYSGIMSITGLKNDQPVRVGSSIGDIIAGHQAAIAILGALAHRDKTGEGQYIDISMVDGLVYILENAIVRYTIDGEIPGPLGAAHPTIVPFQSFKTKDSWIVIPIGNNKLWKIFCKALNREDLINHSKFKTNQLRVKNRDKLIPVLMNIMKTKNTDEWMEIFEEYNLPYSPINTIDKVVEDRNILYRDMIVEIDQPRAGKVKTAGSPFRMSKTPGTVRGHAPLLGEHTEEIISNLLNYNKSELEILKKKNVIK